MLRILTDRGTEYCGRVDHHDYQLYLAINDIDHTKTKAMSPQTNGICERFHKTILNEFYQITFRKKIYSTMEELQKDLDEWMKYYNNERTHQGKMCCGRTPLETLLDGQSIWAEKNLAQIRSEPVHFNHDRPDLIDSHMSIKSGVLLLIEENYLSCSGKCFFAFSNACCMDLKDFLSPV